MTHKHAKGWNSNIEKTVKEAAIACDGQALDFAWRAVKGSCRSARACAEIAINNLIQSPQGLPIPTLDELDDYSTIAIPLVD
jgi:hypothetical protein